MTWITYEEAIAQLVVEAEEDRAQVERTIAEATAIVADYLGPQAMLTWDEMTTPDDVKAAVKLTLAHYYEHRGDDQRLDEDFWHALTRLLMRRRMPALA